jgi:hypothetical protein
MSLLATAAWKEGSLFAERQKVLGHMDLSLDLFKILLFRKRLPLLPLPSRQIQRLLILGIYIPLAGSVPF